MNAVFFAIVGFAFLVAAVRQLGWEGAPGAAEAPMALVSKAMIDAAGASVTLAIGLVGVMALFLGLMKVAEEGGLLTVIARSLKPVMVRLFPEVPAEHPAMGAMILNLSANLLGLGNAATPFGIRAMQELDRLNSEKGTASNAMVLFLAINTSSITLLPTSVIALRAAAGSSDPAGILPTTLFATLFATAVAIAAAKLLQRRFPQACRSGLPEAAGLASAAPGSPEASAVPGAYPALVSWLALAGIVAVIPLMVLFGQSISPWIVPGLMVLLLGFGLLRRVKIYEAFVEGAKEGFQVALRIIPYLVAILVAIGMFRASGALELVITPLGRLTAPFGLPAEALSMALMRTLSGSGAFGLMAAIIQDPDVGPDSYLGYLVSTLQASSETTFYVLAVYFGAVGIRRIRHALAAGLIADLAAVIASVAACLLLFS